MGVIGFTCPVGVPTKGQQNEFDYCVKACPHQCLPSGVLYTIAKIVGKDIHKGDMVSPTALPRCHRKLKLERATEYYIEPQKLYDVTRGSLYHGFLECDGLEGVETEQRIYKVVDRGPQAPWLISGQFDFYDKKREKLEDYKSLAEKGMWFFYNSGTKPDHVWQLNVYKWLMDGGHLGSPSGPVVNYPVKELQLHMLLMNRTVSTGKRFREVFTQRASPNYGKKFKLEISRNHIGKDRKGTDMWEIIFEVPPVPIYSFDEVEEYLVTHGPNLVRAFREPDYMPYGVMRDEDKAWECRFCPVKDICDEIEKADTGADEPVFDFEE